MISKLIYLSGANGFLGTCLRIYFEKSGYDVIQVGKNSASGNLSFDLRNPVTSKLDLPKGAFVHCAWSMNEPESTYFKVNAEASQIYLSWMAEMGMHPIVFISTNNAYEYAKTSYGKAKAQVEEYCLQKAFFVLRLGLVFSPIVQGGSIQRLRDFVNRYRVFPLFGSSQKRIFLSCAEDVAESILEIIRGNLNFERRPIVCTSSKSMRMKQLVHRLLKTKGRKVFFLTLPKFLLDWCHGLLNAFHINVPENLRKAMVFYDLPTEVHPDTNLSKKYRDF